MGTWLAATLPVGVERTESLTRTESVARTESERLRTIFETATSCDDVMSRHRPHTDLRRLNRRAGDPGGVISPDLADVVTAARQLAEQTDGAFDPTVTPLLTLWQRSARRGQAPSGAELRAARACVGWRALQVTGSRVSLGRPGMALDLGGFGKGVALDRIAARLRRHACPSAFLNFGESSLLALGRPPRGRWTIVLRHPFGGYAAAFPLRDRACSTSATVAPRRVAAGGRRARPLVDPRTGDLVEAIAQVTVLARSAAVAEAASTAMLVQGRSALEALAERLDVDACWIDGSGIVTTRWFPLQR
ncbi:MAG TPA: FAD:protein FMN transferase, partial [Methylomirabilota bacterium]